MSFESPVIIIPGFMQTSLFDEVSQLVWFPEVKEIARSLLKNTVKHLSVFHPRLKKGRSMGAELFARVLADVLPIVKCNPDGTGASGVHTYNNNPEERSLQSIISSFERVRMQAYYNFADYLCKNGYKKADRIFFFEYDGRQDAVTLADQLRDFIKKVKAYTKQEKVGIFGVSYGGQIAEAYLHFYMDDGDVDKAVLNAPSYNGTDFPYRLFEGKIEAFVREGIDLLESFLGSDSEYNKIFRDGKSKYIEKMLNSLSEEFAECFRYWGAVYSLTDSEHYEILKEKYLDPVEAAEIIRKNDIVHYEIMPAIKDTLNKSRQKGIDVSVCVNCGIHQVIGGDENSDLLLTVENLSGADTAPVNKRFIKGYGGAKTSCKNPSHYHMSPSREVDASSAFLPENTWFVDGSHHAMFQYEKYGLELNSKLLCTDEIKDVHSDARYPQFMYSRNSHNGIYVHFNKSLPGFVSECDSSVTVENLCKNKEIKIHRIDVTGAAVEFQDSYREEILPAGCEKNIKIKGSLPRDFSELTLKVTYSKNRRFNIMSERTFVFSCTGDFSAEERRLEDNRFFLRKASEVSGLKRFLYGIAYIPDFIAAVKEFSASDAFRYVL